MPIIVNLDDVLYARRMTLTELSSRIGITLANLSILKTGKARAIRFSTLEAICDVLHCKPGDLLGYTPADEAVAAPTDTHKRESDSAITPTMEAQHD